jgi:predicted secreted protein
MLPTKHLSATQKSKILRRMFWTTSISILFLKILHQEIPKDSFLQGSKALYFLLSEVIIIVIALLIFLLYYHYLLQTKCYKLTFIIRTIYINLYIKKLD